MGVNVVVHLGSSREGVKVVAGERGEFGGPVGGARDATVGRTARSRRFGRQSSPGAILGLKNHGVRMGAIYIFSAKCSQLKI